MKKLILAAFALLLAASAPAFAQAIVSPCVRTSTTQCPAVSSDNPLPITTSVPTSGGLSVYFVQPAASTNAATIKAGTGQVFKIEATNISATVNYIRLYDATTGFNGCNSATGLKWQMAVPASTSGTGFSSSWDMGMSFTTGISICVTAGYATNDTTNATASSLSVNVGYK